jgi:hypothetical protein
MLRNCCFFDCTGCPAYHPLRQATQSCNYLSSLQISTTELWLDVTFRAVDAVGPGEQPVPGHNPAMAVFFVAFMIVMSFFILNLFVGVAIDKVGSCGSTRAA